MHQTWQTLMAPADDDAFAVEPANVFGALPDLSVLRATGADTVAFLQGQFTCDVAEVSAGASRLGAWCNAKGRAAVLARLVGLDDGVELLLPRSQLAETRQRLGMYVLRADVKLTPEEDRLCLWAAGEDCEQVLCAQLGHLPRAPQATVGVAGVRALRLPGPRSTYLVVAPCDEIPALWSALEATARPAASSTWELDRIRAGEPCVGPATAGEFVPQMLNLELLGGVSFTKGCYVGQEIVARTQHLGKLKRRMYRARVVGGAPPTPGDAVFGAASVGAQSVGSVVRAAPVPEGGHELLAVLRIDSAEAGGLRLHQLLGPELELLDLPYARGEPSAQ
jgi:folate-binding protein YgfZ